MRQDIKPHHDTPQRSLLHLPALRALGVQILSLVIIAVLLLLLSRLGAPTIPLSVLVLSEGVIAALLSRWVGLATWWWLIQFVFLPMLFGASQLHLSPLIYFAAFAFFLLLYWSTFRTQVPFYPSGTVAWNAVAGLLPHTPSLRIVDIGSGFGGMVMHLAAHRPDCLVLGVELAPLPYFASKMMAFLSRNNARFLLGDYAELDFSDLDVVFAYLSPAAMPALWCKAKKEMRPGSLLLSYEFEIPGIESQFTNISPDDKRILHGWHM